MSIKVSPFCIEGKSGKCYEVIIRPLSEKIDDRAGVFIFSAGAMQMSQFNIKFLFITESEKYSSAVNDLTETQQECLKNLEANCVCIFYEIEEKDRKNIVKDITDKLGLFYCNKEGIVK